MAGQVLLGHPLMGAERDHHGDLLRPAGQRIPGGLQQQRQRTGPGAVRHDQADPLAVQIGLAELGDHEVADLIRIEMLTDAADADTSGYQGSDRTHSGILRVDRCFDHGHLVRTGIRSRPFGPLCARTADSGRSRPFRPMCAHTARFRARSRPYRPLCAHTARFRARSRPYGPFCRAYGRSRRGHCRSGNLPSSRMRLFSSARYSSSSKSSGTSLPVQLDRWMALASRTPLMPSEPGAISGVPSRMFAAKFSRTPACCAPHGGLELDDLGGVVVVGVELAGEQLA